MRSLFRVLQPNLMLVTLPALLWASGCGENEPSPSPDPSPTDLPPSESPITPTFFPATPTVTPTLPPTLWPLTPTPIAPTSTPVTATPTLLPPNPTPTPTLPPDTPPPLPPPILWLEEGECSGPSMERVIVGETGCGAARVSNLGGSALVFSRIELIPVEGDGFDLDADTLPVELAPFETSDIVVTFSPLEAGFASADLELDSNDEELPTAIFSFEGEGYVVEIGDEDQDGFLPPDDCDDLDPTRYPGATEACDGVDQDCDGAVDEGVLLNFFADQDADGHGVSSAPLEACQSAPGISPLDDDCNDGQPTIYPGAEEACDGVDQDCDGEIDEGAFLTFYLDEDGDLYGSPLKPVQACTSSEGISASSSDCNDGDPNINPAATEICDEVDNNCDEHIDEGVILTFCADSDADGTGNPTSTSSGCSAPDDYSTSCDDCNDSDPNIAPGVVEACDGVDQDCDGEADEGVTLTFYGDQDGDGHGSVLSPVQACEGGVGLSPLSDDCDDNDDAVNPSAGETCDTKDNDCDSEIDEGVKLTCYQDLDSDGYGNTSKPTGEACTCPENTSPIAGDCRDTNDLIHPEAPELCNGLDDDCDGDVDDHVTTTYYRDQDQDGYGVTSQSIENCNPPTGYVPVSGDCNDANASIHPNAAESCNDLDDDCDGATDEGVLLSFYWDQDEDGYGAETCAPACQAPPGCVPTPGDCKDTNDAIYPGAQEVCDQKDNDCDMAVDEGVGTLWYADSDADSYGNPSVSTKSCQQPQGYVSNNFDCNDGDEGIHPNADETCNRIDDDCDASVDEGVTTSYFQDLDSDGFGNPNVTTQGCSAPSGYVSNNGDCNDVNSFINPSASEVSNCIDDNCNSQIDEGVYFPHCRDIKRYCQNAPDGVYKIDPDGALGAYSPFETWCDMTTDGGGWTLVASVSTKEYFTDATLCVIDCNGVPGAACNEAPYTDKVAYGNVTTRLARDFKSMAYSLVPFKEFQFRDATNYYATYAVSTSSDVPNVADWYPKGLQNWVPGGTEMHASYSYRVNKTNVPLTVSACSTLTVAFNVEDSDSPIGGACHSITKGPAWSTKNNNDCYWDDGGLPWISGAFGANYTPTTPAYRLWYVR